VLVVATVPICPLFDVFISIPIIVLASIVELRDVVDSSDVDCILKATVQTNPSILKVASIRQVADDIA